jgi:HPt (histidine-containing phosphotransfer) domain-containing protein
VAAVTAEPRSLAAGEEVAGLATLDPRMLDRIRQVRGGGHGFFRDMVELFTTEASSRVRQLGDALDLEDHAAAAEVAHGLRGTSATFGALRLARLCERIEELGVDGEIRAARELFALVKSELSAVTRELAAQLG